MRIKSEALIYKMTSNGSFEAANFEKIKIITIGKRDIYFESNMPLNIGDDFFIGFKIKEYNLEYYKQFPAKIEWRTNLQDSVYPFGYKAKYFSLESSSIKLPHADVSENDNLRLKEEKNREDPRQHLRKACDREISIFANDKIYYGIAVNFSQSGVFIQNTSGFSLEQTIEIVNKKNSLGKDYRLKGKIIRIDSNGIGVKFAHLIDRRSGKERRSDLDRRTGLDRRSNRQRRNEPNSEHFDLLF